ncbi:sugar ABC transporter permease [Paenibacillus chondroitinus]|uniref:Sugar ABC transporter permease n=1 Tax=Paenibacillus chondroitinus TaxID=59842 RepID=A0ABU6DLH4_9BACL|nr:MULTISPECIES: sugar ABC transporter permease [Paenibacillus]MCY9660678.1 sugar ABC transporter permease [Paenibacillus anseongense]MEB4798142.1 sugar ABC transporter permease [Paenibacillus chondroitinus]
MKQYLGNKWAILFFLTPAIVLYSVIVFYPILQTVYRSFFEWDGLSDATFIGVRNYIDLSQDYLLTTSLRNGFLFALVLVIFQIGLGTLLALICSDPTVKGRKILKTAYFIPVVLSVTVVCQLWLSMYDPVNGIINKLFQALGIAYQQDWLNSPSVSIIAIAFVNAWQYMGFQFALLYAGAKSVPEHYTEAARIDGAGKWRAHWHITLPLMKETFKFCFIIAITAGIGAYVQMAIMTNGGPGTTNYTITFMIIRNAFSGNQYGYACAISVLLIVISLIATIIINKVFDSRETGLEQG